MPRMYCSHVAYCTTLSCSNSHHQSSPQEILVAKGGTMWARNARWILPEMPDWSFTCRKSTTWNRRLYFPSEGRRAEDFFALENPTASAEFEPANLGTKSQHATSRPTKPLLGPLLFNIFINSLCNVIKHSKYLLFVDDFKVFLSINSVGDCIML